MATVKQDFHTAHDLRRYIKEITRVSRASSPEELKFMDALDEAVTDFQREKALRLLADDPAGPAMFIYSSDGWSSRVKDGCTISPGEDLTGNYKFN